MTFGEDWGSMLPGASKEESKKIFDFFVSKGRNFTAKVYQNGTSEKYVGEFISSEREMFVLATKYTLMTSPNLMSRPGLFHMQMLLQNCVDGHFS